jgi:hypothetical protein
LKRDGEGSGVCHAMLDEHELVERNKASDFTLGVVASLLEAYGFDPQPISKIQST